MTRDGVIAGIGAIRDALANLGLNYSYSWVRRACSKRFPGTPIPVTRRRGGGPQARVVILASQLVAWAVAYDPITTHGSTQAR